MQQTLSPDKHIQHESRTSENCWIEHDANDIVHEVSKRFSILVQMPFFIMRSSTSLFIIKKELNISHTLIHLIMKQKMVKIIGSLAGKE